MKSNFSNLKNIMDVAEGSRDRAVEVVFDDNLINNMFPLGYCFKRKSSGEGSTDT